MRRLARQVAAMNAVKRVHRIRILAGTITQGTDTSFSLLTCDDDPNYDLTTDGTNVAECEPGAKVVAVQLHMSIYGMPAGEVYEWTMYRDPDGALGAASNGTIATLYTADFTASNAVQRKNTFLAGHVCSSTSKEVYTDQIRITSKALRRAARFADGDLWRMTFTATPSATSPSLYLRGRIITRGP